MRDMLVLAFDGEDTAMTARDKLIELDKQYVLKLDQVVSVVRKADGQVKIKQEPRFTGIAALGGAFWGLLIGLIFLVPVVGVVVGAVGGAIFGHFANYGISKDFMKQIEQAIQPGDSALFILADDVKIDRVVPMLAPLHPRVLRTSLSADQEQKLKDAFGAMPATAMPVSATA